MYTVRMDKKGGEGGEEEGRGGRRKKEEETENIQRESKEQNKGLKKKVRAVNKVVSCYFQGNTLL